MKKISLIALFGVLTLAPAPSQADTLRFRLTSDPATLDWNLAHTSHETYIIMNIMEGLMEYDSDMKLRGALAERWDVSADGKTYKFYLRGGVKWSDGKALRAQDFVDSWQRLLDPKNKSSYAKLLSAVAGVKAVSDTVFEVKLSRPVPYFLHLPTFWVTFPVRMDAIRAKKVVTLGPYLLEKWERGKKITLSRNTGYLGFVVGNDPARLPESVEAVIEPNDAKARKLFHDGKLDVLINATTADLLAEGKSSRLEQFPYLATYYLGFDVRRIKDGLLRKALAQAVDRDQIPSVMQGGQTAASGWVPPGIEGHGDKQSLTGTLYESRGMLSKAGYPEGKGFPRLSLWVETFDGADRLAEFLITHFKERLGISVVRTQKENGADLFIRHWGADFPHPANFFEVFSSLAGKNYTGWKSPGYDKLVAAGKYADAEKILLQQEVVVLPIFYQRNTALLGPRIDRFNISPLNYLFIKDVTLKKK